MNSPNRLMYWVPAVHSAYRTLIRRTKIAKYQATGLSWKQYFERAWKEHEGNAHTLAVRFSIPHCLRVQFLGTDRFSRKTNRLIPEKHRISPERKKVLDAIPIYPRSPRFCAACHHRLSATPAHGIDTTTPRLFHFHLCRKRPQSAVHGLGNQWHPFRRFAQRGQCLRLGR